MSLLALAVLGAIGGALYVKWSQTASYNPQTKIASPAAKGASGQTGGVVDNSKSASTAPTTASTSQPASSSSGIIMLDSPASGATIGNGTVVSGTADGLTQVEYRIKDTVRGVIASGALNVTNGRFSGTIQGLQPGSSTGTFEVFDYKDDNGPEENHIEINVSFK